MIATLTVSIPTWVTVLFVIALPFILGKIADRIWPARVGMFSLPFEAFLVFVISAAACWVGLIVWWVMR